LVPFAAAGEQDLIAGRERGRVHLRDRLPRLRGRSAVVRVVALRADVVDVREQQQQRGDHARRPALTMPPCRTAMNRLRSSRRLMFLIGSPSTTSTSASLPGWSVPSSLSRPRISAPVFVAQRRVSVGEKPISFTKKVSSLA